MQAKHPFLNAAVSLVMAVLGGRRVVESAGVCGFEYEVDITAAQLIAGQVQIFPDGVVPTGCKPFLEDYQINWGATAFGAATDVRISDGTVDFVTIAIANTLNALHRKSPTGVTQTGVTQGAAIIGAPGVLGGTVNKGLLVRTTGSTPTLGSTFRVYVKGYFAKS